MVGDAFELQRDAAQRQRPRRAGGAGQRLDQLAIGGRMAGAGIAGDRLGEVDAALVGPAAQRRFDAAVLVSERDFEMEDALAVTIEAKMPGLDDPGMHRANRDFVDFGPGNLKEIDLLDGRAAMRKAHRLEPGVTLRDGPPIARGFRARSNARRGNRGSAPDSCRRHRLRRGRSHRCKSSASAASSRVPPASCDSPARSRSRQPSPIADRTVAAKRGRRRRRGSPRSPPAPHCRS